MLTDAAKDGKFSETLVKQLLRQGEDRKTTVEETKLLDLKVKDVKTTVRKHRIEMSKMLKAFEMVQGELKRT
jgi:hypothetical protein